MRLLFISLSTLLLGCGPPPPKCTTGASDLKISNSAGGVIHQADAACAGWNVQSLNVFLDDVEVASDETLQAIELGSRVAPQTAGSFDCERAELGVAVTVNISSDRRFQYSDGWYSAGNDPGSQIPGTSCTWEVTTAPPSEASGAIAGTFVGRLARVRISGETEFIDVRFNFATKQ